MMEPTARPDPVFQRDWHRQYPVIDYGEGVFLYDKSGKRYLDGSGGVHVVSVGHGVKEIAEVAGEQTRRCAFAFNAHFTSEPQHALAAKVLEMAPEGMARVYFVSGGSEANEVALAIARQYYIERGKPSKHRFVARWRSFHGTTIGAISMTGHSIRRTSYMPYLLNFPHIEPSFCYRCTFGKTYPRCDLDCAWDLERTIKNEGPDSIAGFIAEPVVGTTAGAVVPPKEYFPIVRDICDRYDVLLVADEVITGGGRTGKNFGMQHWGVTPDIITMGKGLASGYTPLAAIILHDKVFSTFAQGPVPSTFFIGHTYSGNPVSCAVGLAVQEYIQRHDLVNHCAEIGAYLKQRMEERLSSRPIVGDIRGIGLLLAIEFVKDRATHATFERKLRVAETFNRMAFENGLVLISGNGTVDGYQGDHILVTPPFTLSRSEADLIVDLLEKTAIDLEHSLGI